jgi:hypothetical protein
MAFSLKLAYRQMFGNTVTSPSDIHEAAKDIKFVLKIYFPVSSLET